MSDTLARRKNACNMQSKRFELDQKLPKRITSHFINSELSTNRASNETSIEIVFVSEKDTKFEPRFEHGDQNCKITQIGNTNISTQMEAGIFVPIVNDFKRCALATGESSTRSQEDNRKQTTKKGVFQDQKAMSSLKNDQNDQSTTSERKKDIDIFNCRHNNESSERKMRRGLKQKFKFKRSWEVRAFVTSILIAVQTILLTGPFISSFWIEIINGTMLSIQTKFTLFFLYLANSLSNPIIYAWRISEIRQEFRKLFNRNN
ncbi:CNR1 [Mytilus coruscus]|uniref:CNR1 n=1 Tax=Mytilus coruscus TaxID=42192 RepID=A0A6J8AT91_MYTCO|nr:CNR1 [Mytilus coruscus]